MADGGVCDVKSLIDVSATWTSEWHHEDYLPNIPDPCVSHLQVSRLSNQYQLQDTQNYTIWKSKIMFSLYNWMLVSQWRCHTVTGRISRPAGHDWIKLLFRESHKIIYTVVNFPSFYGIWNNGLVIWPLTLVRSRGWSFVAWAVDWTSRNFTTQFHIQSPCTLKQCVRFSLVARSEFAADSHQAWCRCKFLTSYERKSNTKACLNSCLA